MREKDIIIAGLKSQFEIDLPEVYRVEFKRLTEVQELMGDDDSYDYCDGGSHDTYSLIAVYHDGRQESFKNTSHCRYAANHEPDVTDEGDDLDDFLRGNLNADCFLLHYSHSASWEDDEQDEEILYVIIPSEREKRKFLFTARNQYQEFVNGINKELFGHAGDDDYISVLVPVNKREEILKLLEEL